MKVRKGDQVLVITGKDKGKTGVIEKVFPKENRLIITGVNLSKRHLKPSRKNPQGGIINKPAPMQISNVMVVCPRCNKPTRVGYNQNQDKKSKARICKKCQESLSSND